MTEQFIDLTKIDFWLVLLFAVIFVGPLNVGRYKSAAWAIINCVFIISLLHWQGMLMLLAVLIVYLALQVVNGRFRVFATIVVSFILFVLFLTHKSSAFMSADSLSPLQYVLSVTGFSYIALRMVELLRAVFEQRYGPPTLIGVINYLIPFHMLAAGPIQCYDDFVSKSYETTARSSSVILEAIERIVFGLFKKFVLAYFIHELFLTGFESTGLYFVLEVQLFFLWLYLDFSAYSDIAVGVGRLVGIPTPENFNKPYLARNAIDFWERWHITLSHFVKRNIFTPIQLFLGRKTNGQSPLLSASIAFSVAFVACGLWHGLTINFVIWGGIHAIALIVANLYRAFLKKRLGIQGLKKYMANKLIQFLARTITYEYVAFSLVVLFYP